VKCMRVTRDVEICDRALQDLDYWESIQMGGIVYRELARLFFFCAEAPQHSISNLKVGYAPHISMICNADWPFQDMSSDISIK
jgi:hypothetical protein